MTSAEAIDRIRDHMAIHFLSECPRAVKITEALELAIAALEECAYQPSEAYTNENYIRHGTSRKQLAELLVKEEVEPDYDEGIDGEMHECGSLTFYITPDGEKYCEDRDGAIEHTCWWLAKEKTELTSETALSLIDH